MSRRRLRGSCLCGAVRFEVEPPFLRANHCHCGRCRRHSGANGLMQARVPRARFHLIDGASCLGLFTEHRHAAKVFCTHCGASLFGGKWPDGEEVSIRLGAFDDDPGIRPLFHTFVRDRAAWDEIQDELPQFSGRATRAQVRQLGMGGRDE